MKSRVSLIIAAMLVIAALPLAAGCVSLPNTEGRPCPCAEGFQCCGDMCVTDTKRACEVVPPSFGGTSTLVDASNAGAQASADAPASAGRDAEAGGGPSDVALGDAGVADASFDSDDLPEAAPEPNDAGDAGLTCPVEPALCGDGIVQAGEACDDGDSSATNGCDPDCRWGVTAVAMGSSHSCALGGNGSVKCWGSNFFGQLGLGDEQHRGDAPDELGDKLPAVNLGSGVRAQAIAAGGEHTCALLEHGAVKCWGANNAGQLGLGDTEDRGDDADEMGEYLAEVKLGTEAPVVAIAAGGDHTCALLQDGIVKCWGANFYGQLGLGDANDRGSASEQMDYGLPAVDLGQYYAIAIAAGSSHTCALLNTYQVTCWGHNVDGRLGLGNTANRGDEPGEMGENLATVQLGSGLNVWAIAAGSDHTCAWLSDDGIKCWGDGRYGQLGQGDEESRGDQSEPNEMGDELPYLEFGEGLAVQALYTAADTTCVLFTSGKLKCIGANDSGQLGLGDAEPRGDDPGETMAQLPFIDVSGADTIVTALGISSDASHTCAVLENGELKCWGYNAGGQLGVGATDERGDGSDETGVNLSKVELSFPNVDDLAAPVVQAFRVPETSVSQTVPVSICAYDNVGVTGYFLMEGEGYGGEPPYPPSLDDPGWTVSAPTEYTTPQTVGEVRVYVYVKDAAGNISKNPVDPYAFGTRAVFNVVDAYEPDDLAEDAKLVTVDAPPQERSSTASASRDWAKFNAVAGRVYTVTVVLPDDYLGAAGREDFALISVYAADDLATPFLSQRETGSIKVELSFLATSAGTFYVRYQGRDYYRPGADPHEDYTLAVKSYIAAQKCSVDAALPPEDCDGEAPLVTSFSASPFYDQTGQSVVFAASASDNVAIAGYYLVGSEGVDAGLAPEPGKPLPDAPGWRLTKPIWPDSKPPVGCWTWGLYVKDFAGNVSELMSTDEVCITE